MHKKIAWLVLSCLTVLILLATACAPAPAEEKAPAPAVPAAPAVKETAPAVKEATPIEAEGMVKLTLTKRDGTKVEKLVEKPQYGGVLNSFLTAPPDYWNGDKGTWPEPIWEALVQYDWTKGPAGTNEIYIYSYGLNLLELGANLAEIWEMPDATTLVFHIRQGVHFQNKAPAFGREVTAYDFEFGARRAWTVPTSYVCRNYLEKEHFPDGSVEKAINALDKWTLQVKSQPGLMSSVYEMVATHYVMALPPEMLKYDMNDWKNAGGTGPFILTDYVPGSSITYQRNPDYWGKDPLHPKNQLPYLDGYKELIIPDASTRLAALRTAKIDVLGGSSIAAGTLTWEDAASLKKTNPELKFVDYPLGVSPTLYMRVDTPGLPWHDVRVRRALAMAIDNQTIKDDFYGGQADIFAWPISKGTFLDLWRPLEEYPKSVQKLFGYYPEEAKQLLKEAGYPNGFKAEVITQAANVDMLSIVAAYWKKNLNVEMDIQVRETAVYNSVKTYHTHKEMLMGQAQWTSPIKLIHVRPGRLDQNSSQVLDPWVEEVFYKLMELYFDPPAQAKLFRDSIPRMWEQAWFIQLPDPYVSAFWQPWVRNFYERQWIPDTSLRDICYKYVWLDLDMKEAMTGKR